MERSRRESDALRVCGRETGNLNLNERRRQTSAAAFRALFPSGQRELSESQVHFRDSGCGFQIIGSEVIVIGFKCRFCHETAMWPWESHLTSLGFSFFFSYIIRIDTYLKRL